VSECAAYNINEMADCLSQCASYDIIKLRACLRLNELSIKLLKLELVRVRM
jgi:hypothetical protein